MQAMRRSGRGLRGVAARAAGLAALGLALAALGCASLTDPLHRRSNFEDTQQRFTQYVRWGDMARASEYVEPELRDAFLSLGPEFSEIRFTDYEILHMDIAAGTREATVDVRYSGYQLSMMLEKHVDVRQEWHKTVEGWRVRMDVDRIREALRRPGS